MSRRKSTSEKSKVDYNEMIANNLNNKSTSSQNSKHLSASSSSSNCASTQQQTISLKITPAVGNSNDNDSDSDDDTEIETIEDVPVIQFDFKAFEKKMLDKLNSNEKKLDTFMQTFDSKIAEAVKNEFSKTSVLLSNVLKRHGHGGNAPASMSFFPSQAASDSDVDVDVDSASMMEMNKPITTDEDLRELDESLGGVESKSLQYVSSILPSYSHLISSFGPYFCRSSIISRCWTNRIRNYHSKRKLPQSCFR